MGVINCNLPHEIRRVRFFTLSFCADRATASFSVIPLGCSTTIGTLNSIGTVFIAEASSRDLRALMGSIKARFQLEPSSERCKPQVPKPDGNFSASNLQRDVGV